MRTPLRLKRPGAFRQAIAEAAGSPLAEPPRAFAFLCLPPPLNLGCRHKQ